MQVIFLILTFSIFYCYLGYPILIYFFASFNEKKVNKLDIEPKISIIISAYNEENCIEDKIKNLHSLDYPTSKVEIIIGSDGSSDRTNQIINSHLSSNFLFYPFKQRRGKMATLNDLVSKAQNEILVFTDARQSFERSALRKLVANFHDQSVGCVSGELCFKLSPNSGSTSKGINLYWNYEKLLRDRESRIHSMLGATGAIYAIRRELFTPIPENLVLDDMFVPLKIVQKGFRAIFDTSANAYDTVADSPAEEHRRKVRTLYGNYQILYLLLDLLNPLTSPVAIQLISHKLLRLIAPFLLISLFIINIFLVTESFIYQILMLSQIIFYALATLGVQLRSRQHGLFKLLSKICYIPYVFCLLNFSALAGFFKFVKRQQTVTWEKAK